MVTRAVMSYQSGGALATRADRHCPRPGSELQAEREAHRDAGEEVVARVALELDSERFVTRPERRRAWLREGRRALEAQRDRQPEPVLRDRRARIAGGQASLR
jgi:hypothetical protein